MSLAQDLVSSYHPKCQKVFSTTKEKKTLSFYPFETVKESQNSKLDSVQNYPTVLLIVRFLFSKNQFWSTKTEAGLGILLNQI